MSQPKRIQRKREKGWRMPEGVKYVGRGSKWGNPYLGDRSQAVRNFRVKPPQAAVLEIEELRGKDLACWCPLDGEPCHADVLLEWANGVEPVRKESKP